MRLLHQSIQHAIINLLDLIGQLSVLVIDQPLQHGLFVLQISLVQEWISIPRPVQC